MYISYYKIKLLTSALKYAARFKLVNAHSSYITFQCFNNKENVYRSIYLQQQQLTLNKYFSNVQMNINTSKKLI